MDRAAPAPVNRGALASARETFAMIQFPHTIFALPFALLSAFRAAKGVPAAATLGWIVVAMISARTAAMTFNRVADRKLDAKNPRTAGRALPARRLSVPFAAAVCAAAAVTFLFCAFQLNVLAFRLAIPTLALLFFYSATKRFTSLSHLVLGLCLGIAPAGAWIAVEGRLSAACVWLGVAVLFWTAGFDVIYSLQDETFDRQAGLFSLPAKIGPRQALVLSALFHLATLCFLALFARSVEGGPLLRAAIGLAACGLLYQHSIVRPGDLSRVDAAFFTANGFISVAVGALGIADLWVPVR